MRKSPTILAVETSTSACSAALMVDGETQQRYLEGSNIHSREILLMVDGLLRDCEFSLKGIDLIAAGIGPGSFTGLRIGVGVAQGLAYSHDIPVCPVSSLHALAVAGVECQQLDWIVAGLDARMSEIYWAAFNCCALQSAPVRNECSVKPILSGEYRLDKPRQISLPKEIGGKVGFVGNAWSIYLSELEVLRQDKRVEGALSERLLESVALYPEARHVASQAFDFFQQGKEMPNCRDLAPLYVRNEVAKKSLKQPLAT